MRPFSRSFTAAAALLAFAGLAAAGSASSRAADVTLDGKLTVVHSDDFAHGRSEIHATLDTGQASYALQLADDTSLPRASTVRVQGRQLSGTTVAVGKGGVSAAPGSTVVAATTGAKKVLVVLVKFADQSTTPSSPTPSSAAGVVFTNANSVANYYNAVSWGKLTLSGDVTPWVTIPSTNEASTCDYNTWGSQANTAAANAGFNPSNYNYVQYALNSATSCGWAGLAYLPGTTSWVRAEYLDLRVSGHELGHNFGTHHSNSYSCSQSGTAVALSTTANCTSSEYGDPFSIMGQGQSSIMEHTNFSRGNFGWLTSANTQDVTSTGTYSLDPAEANDPTGVQALRISRGSSTYLLLEVREPDGTPFDSFSPTNPVATGVTVRVVPTYSSMSQSQLVDTTPGDGNFSNAPLALNQSVYDPVSNATVKTTAVSSSGATVSVTFGADSTAPSAPSGLAANATDGTHVALTWGASTDNVGVTGYRVYRVGTGLVGTSSTTAYTDSGLTPSASYSYYVTAVDAATNESTASNTASATTPTVDTQRPSAPTGVATSKLTKPTRVRVGWTASTDNVGVAGYRVYRNGTQLGTSSTTTYTDAHPLRGTNTYTVYAYDAAGNLSLASSPSSISVK
jgi:chitodextrinase